MRLIIILASGSLLLGCTEDRVEPLWQTISTPSPDHRHVAVVCDVLAENTTGSIPKLFLLRAEQERKDKVGHVIDGGLNGMFAASWSSSQSPLVQYRAGEWDPHLPTTTNVGRVTIEFERVPP